MSSTGFELLAQAVPAIVPPLIRGVVSTCSLRIINRKVREEVIDRNRAYVGVVWHKDFVFALDYFRHRKVVVMVSRSGDGELVSRLIHRLGYQTVRGSSSAGGREARVELTQKVREGYGSAIIADGPRGPARVAKIGCVVAARDAGVPLILFGCHIEPNLTLRNWNGTLLPKPFSRIVVAFGDPIRVASTADRDECEAVRKGVDLKMAELEAACRAKLP